MVTVVLELPLDRQESERLLAFCRESGVDCFAVDFTYWEEQQRDQIEVNFFERLLPSRVSPRLLERTVIYAGRERFVLTECWSLNDETIRLILAACDGSLSNDAQGQTPEDWRFYRNDKLFLGFVSHEHYAFLQFSEQEAAKFKQLGIPHSVQE